MADRDSVHNEVPGAVEGSVVQARDIQKLTFTSGPAEREVELVVRPSHAAIEAGPAWQQYAYRWIGNETAQLGALADAYDWQQNALGKVVRKAYSFKERPWRGAWAANLTGALVLGGLSAGGAVADRRPRRMFEEHVELFADQAYRVFRQRAMLQLEDHEAACVRVTVHNPSDFHFADIALKLRFDSSALGFSDDLWRTLPPTRPELPRRPPPPGLTGPVPLLLWALFALDLPPAPVVARTADPGWSGQLRGTWFEVTFGEFGLRPREERALPPVPLTVLLPLGGALAGQWSATASSANGVADGTFELPVVESTFDLQELGQPGPPEVVPSKAEVRSWFLNPVLVTLAGRRLDWF